MKRSVVSALLALATLLIACDGDDEPVGERPSAVIPEEPAASNEAVSNGNTECFAEARGAVMALKRGLVQRLSEALAESPEAAVEVCSREAEVIRARVQQETGVQLGRTASRLRNPVTNGDPPAWVRSYLAAYEEGESDAPVEWTERVASEARLVSPLIAGQLCLTCHGEEIAPPVLAAIDEHYPNDQARGYHAGDLRGVVWAINSCD